MYGIIWNSRRNTKIGTHKLVELHPQSAEELKQLSRVIYFLWDCALVNLQPSESDLIFYQVHQTNHKTDLAERV